MNDKLYIELPETKQSRSEKTLEDILQAAYEIVELADPSLFNGRSLAKKSGYALGTMNKRLGPIENAFVWAISKGRDLHVESMKKKFEQFDSHLSIQTFFEVMVDFFFNTIKNVNPMVIRFYEDCLTRQNKQPPDVHSFIDVLAKPYIDLVQRNQSNSFRQVSEQEAILLLRATLTLLERPFVELNPIAGTEDHRVIAISTLVGMFGNSTIR